MPSTSLVVFALGVVLVSWHVWFAFGMSQVFAAFERPRWAAWIPVVNEAELFVCAGRSRWLVLLYFVPVLALYGLALRAAAIAQIARLFPDARAAVTLGMLLPPVWANRLSASLGAIPPKGGTVT